ncbi:hypothetical protein D3C84_672690 [compost metagenome]
MANRSKKVVLSVRIDPYLKAALELAASSQKEKIVKYVEVCIGFGLGVIDKKNPFSKEKDSEVKFDILFASIWSEDEVVYKLRLGFLGGDFAEFELIEIARMVIAEKRFQGDFDLFGDLNGNVQALGFIAPDIKIDVDKVKAEWEVILEYAEFRKKNPSLQVDYEKYLLLAC